MQGAVEHRYSIAGKVPTQALWQTCWSRQHPTCPSMSCDFLNPCTIYVGLTRHPSLPEQDCRGSVTSSLVTAAPARPVQVWAFWANICPRGPPCPVPPLRTATSFLVAAAPARLVQVWSFWACPLGQLRLAPSPWGMRCVFLASLCSWCNPRLVTVPPSKMAGTLRLVRWLRQH